MSMPRQLPPWLDLFVLPLVNVLTAFVVAGIVVLIIGENPLEISWLLLKGSLGSFYGLGYTLYYATSFIFAGLAVALAFQAGHFNVGVEGQAYVAGLGAAVTIPLAGIFPTILLVPAGILGSLAFGALWALIPGYLQARRGSHIVITTIMFNWLAATLMSYLLVDVLRRTGSMIPESGPFPKGASLIHITDLINLCGVKVPSTPLNLAFPLSLLAAVLVYFLIWRTPFGYEIRTVGSNENAAIYGGISPARVTMIVMALSGALAGGVAVNQLLGLEHRLLLEFVAGFGFVGIAVALMGRAHPLGVVLAAILFGMLYQGGAEVAFEKPMITRDMIVLIQGLVVLFAGSLEGMFRRPIAASWSLLATKRMPSHGSI